MENNSVYAIGYLDGNEFAYIGWNAVTDYYDVVYSGCLSDEEGWAFKEESPCGEPVYVYRFESKEEAEEELREAQTEFDEELRAIKLIKQDGYWFPEFDTIAYAIGFLTNDSIHYIGLNKTTQAYDMAYNHVLRSEDGIWDFLGENHYGEKVEVCRFITEEEAHIKRVEIQKEFDETLVIIRLEKIEKYGDTWVSVSHS